MFSFWSLQITPHHRHRHGLSLVLESNGSQKLHIRLLWDYSKLLCYPLRILSHIPRNPLTIIFYPSSARLAAINIGGKARGFSESPKQSPTNTNYEPRGDFGLIGLAVMGQNLILNAADHGFNVIAFNRTVSKVDHFLANEAKGKQMPDSSVMEYS